MKLLFYDLETTGVKYWRNGIHQIAGIVVVDGVIKQDFNIKLRPHPNAEILDEAIAVSGVTREQIAGYQPMEKGKEELTQILSKYVDRYNKNDKFFLVGYNNKAFDDQFLRALFELCGDTYFNSYFWTNSLDVMVLASMPLLTKRNRMANFKLSSVANALHISFDEQQAHDALYDVRKTKEIFDLIQML